MKRYRQMILMKAILLLSGPLFAQDLINQTNIYIDPAVEIYLDGNVLNEGFMQHQGVFSFSGNWINNNIYQGSGTVVAKGSDNQIIFNKRQPIANLVINGSGDKVIQGFLPITNRLELLSGLVVTSPNDTLLLQSSSVISGGSEVSYVNGPLYSAGVGYKFFPIGKGDQYNPVELTDIIGINPVIGLEVLVDVPAIQTPPRVDYFTDIYWQRSLVSGTFSGSPVMAHYQIPDHYTDSRDVEILQSSSLDAPFTTLQDVSVSFNDGLDAVRTDDLVTEKNFLIGSSVPIGGAEGEFYFSTSLSPKAGNAENNTIKVFGNRLEDAPFLFQVYNRWGVLVFESSSLQDMIDHGWNGSKQNGGDYVPAGVYPYIFKARTKTGETLEKKGVITVVY